MSKQDRQGVRTPSQLEQKYNFDQRFSGASQTAEAARVFAGEANETAKLAKAQADAAKTTAESAKATAERAESNVSGAATGAANADAKASSALEKATGVTVLATPNKVMGRGDNVSLSLSAQPKGIVLVWSAYTIDGDNNVPSYSDLHYMFIPKTESGNVCTGLMVSEYGQLGFKTVTISADSIAGNIVNTSDEQYSNTHWVLCRVLGV